MAVECHPDEHWGHTDDELVDRLLVEKKGRQSAQGFRQIAAITVPQV
jgi:hypothetical protein